MADRIDRRFSRAVKVGDLRNHELLPDLVLEARREGLAAQDQMIQRHVRWRLVDDGLEVRRHAADEGDTVPLHFIPELRRRLTRLVADDYDGPAADERQQRLL